MLFLGINTISVKADIREHRTTWDCIWFGRYPQTEVRDVTSFTNKKYFNNSKGQQCGYVAKNKAGEKVTIGMVVSLDERFTLEYRTGADKHFYYKPIKWRILKKEGRKVLLLSDKIIDQYYVYTPSDTDIGIKYTGLQMDFVWRNSSLRKYMNDVMYDMAFTEDEKYDILDSKVTSGFTYKDEQDVTEDRLFILSYDELVNDYGFHTQESLVCRISDFAKASGIYKYDSYGKYGTYFTLSDGYKSDHIQYGEDSKYAWCDAYNNAIDNLGILKRENALYCNGIRVAMWVDLTDCTYQYAGTVSSDGEVNEVKFKYPIKLSKIKIKSVKNVKKKTVSIKFQKVKDAKKYKIQYATNKRFKKAKVRVCKKTSYQIKKLKKGKVYYVRVRALNGKKQGKWSKVSRIKIRR